MITLTESASKELEAYFTENDKGTIRIYMAGGCSGPRLALALDDAGDEDQAFAVDSFSFCINKELLQAIEGVTLDMSPMGFEVEPVKPLPASAGGGCGGGCGGGGGHGEGGGCCGGSSCGG